MSLIPLDPPFDAESPARFVIAGALAINAALAFWTYNNLGMEWGRGWMLFGASAIALLILIPAVTVLVKPSELMLSAASGLALTVIVVMLLVGALVWLAAVTDLSRNFRSETIVVGLVLIGILQIVIIVATSAMRDRSVVETIARSVAPGFGYWFAGLAVHVAVATARRMVP